MRLRNSTPQTEMCSRLFLVSSVYGLPYVTEVLVGSLFYIKMGLQESRLEPDDLNDLLRDTSYTSEEILKWYKKFASVYPNGHLTIEEFKCEFGKTFPDGDASEFAEHVFRTFDTNGDGVVDFREYLFALYVTSHGRIDQKLRLAFTLYDIDGNGAISWNELETVLKSVHKAMGIRRVPGNKEILKKRISKIYNQFDRNKDGKIVLEEFIDTVTGDPAILRLLRSDPMSLH